jgi:hypothetical protein
MALSDKNIVIIPSIGASTGTNPRILFTGGDATSSATIALSVYNSGTQGTLSFSGNSGQLFSIVDSVTGTIFSVNDISGIPSIEVLDTGLVKLAQYNGVVAISTGTAVSGYKLSVFGGTSLNGNNQITGITTITNTTQASSTNTGALQVAGGVGIAGNLWVGGTINATIQGTISTATNANNIATVAQTANAAYYPTFVDANNTTSAYELTYTTSSFKLNPSGSGAVYIGVGNDPGNFNSFASLQVGGPAIYANGFNNLNISTNIAGGVDGGGSTGTYAATGTPAARYQQVVGSHVWYNAPVGTAGNAIAWNQVMVINTLSNVGIGISSPESRLHVSGDARITGITTVTNATQSTSTTTGGLVVNGGVGIGGNLFVGGEIVAQKLTIQLTTVTTTLIETDDIIKTTNTTAATSTVTGALQVAGGAGIGGNIFAGGRLFAALRADATSSSTAWGVYFNPITREITTSTSGAAAAVVTISDTPPSSPTVGSLWFDSDQAEMRIYYQDQDSNQWVGVTSSAAQVATTRDRIIANDISNQFNGFKTVFQLRQDQTLINTVVDSKDVEVVINGQRLTPYVDELRFPWFTPYDSYRGFRVVGSNLIIYNSPFIGDSASVVVNPASTTRQKRRYPFSATTIALGD